MGDNAYDWMDYVNQTLTELKQWQERREQDLSMENMRLRRLLDATLQRLGESESALLPASESDTQDIENDSVGPTASS